MTRSRARGLAVAAVALVVAPVLLEGATSLFTGTPLSDRLLSRGGGALVRKVDAPAAATLADGAALTVGPYALHPDPTVGFTVKRSFKAPFHEAEASTDAHGMRVRLGPPPEPGAPRVVLLGDSVAFGHGVSDAEAPAQQLEEMLRAAAAPERPAPVVLSVACPGWNRRASYRYLRDNLERLDPDIVVFMLVNNDLDDATIVNELGWRSVGQVDEAGRSGREPIFPPASAESSLRLHRTLEYLPSRAATAEVLLAGGPRVIENALRTGLTPESVQRWDELCAETAALFAELEAREIRFAVALTFDVDFLRQAEVRLAAGAPDVPRWGLSAGYTPDDSLVGDSHYNAATTREHARRIAEHLVGAGWLEGADAARLPAPESAFEGRAYAALAPDERAPFLDKLHDEFRAFLRDAVDLRRIEGIHQVYGGLDGDGTVGRAVYAALSRPGATRLVLRIERLPRDAAAYPLSLAARIGGIDVGSRDVPPPEPEAGDGAGDGDGDGKGEEYELAFDVPAELRAVETLDVLVTASAWVEEPGPPAAPGPRLASFRLRRMALVGD